MKKSEANDESHARIRCDLHEAKHTIAQPAPSEFGKSRLLFYSSCAVKIKDFYTRVRVSVIF